MSGRPGENENVESRGTENLSGLELAARQLYGIRAQIDATLSFVVREIQLEKMAARMEEPPAPDRSENVDAVETATNRVLNRSDIRGAPRMPPTFRGPQAAAPSPGTDSQPSEEVAT